MKFAVYLPPQVEAGVVPVIYWLSGLTCNEQNFIQKSGFQRYAAQHGFAVVCPDTSPSKLYSTLSVSKDNIILSRLITLVEWLCCDCNRQRIVVTQFSARQLQHKRSPPSGPGSRPSPNRPSTISWISLQLRSMLLCCSPLHGCRIRSTWL